MTGLPPPPPPGVQEGLLEYLRDHPDQDAQVMAALGLAPRDSRVQPADEPLRSIGPGGMSGQDTGGYELRVTATVGTGREVMQMAGQNAGGFELRATQGQL